MVEPQRRHVLVKKYFMLNKEVLKSIFSDIRIWILLFFCVRIIGITNPPLEIGHNWRQSLTNMIARNFLEIDANILFPRIDMAGNQTGIIGSEFPFYNYLIYLVSLVFGYSHWYGRLINLIVCSFGTYAFYLLIKEICNKKIAFHATIVFLSSIWFAFSRKVMPDTFSVAFVLIGLYFCYTYLKIGTLWKLLLFFLFVTLGMLCKIPALSLISLISIVILVKEIPLNKKLIVISATAVSIAIVFIWYFYWDPYLLKTYHYQLYFPKGLLEGLKEILLLLPEFYKKFYFDSLSSYLALPFLIAGIYFIARGGNFYLKIGLSIVTATFFLFILKTGAVFPLHNYYIIPFTPVMALIVGYGLSKLNYKHAYVALTLIVVESVLNQQHDFRIHNNELYKLSLEGITKRYVPNNELIVINGGESPQVMYFSHRKGWTVENTKLTRNDLNLFARQGASFLIIDKHKFLSSIDYYPLIYSNQHFAIYKLKQVL